MHGLRYVSDEEPGYTRRRAGKGWSYKDEEGSTIRDGEVRARIEELAIPPAWTEVWICPDPLGHIQATGRDDAGRKQYRYHPRWREVRNRDKYARLIGFGESLPDIRKGVAAALRREGLDRERVLAAVVRLLETTCIRIGSEKYQRRNETFGLATLRSRHVDLEGIRLRFCLNGKGGKTEEAEVTARRVADVVRGCQELDGQELFAYRDEHGGVCDVTSTDVNRYIRTLSGAAYTAKDFRTWMGTLHAFVRLCHLGEPSTDEEADAGCLEAVNTAADHLRNTRAVTREFYVHPAVLQGYREGWLMSHLKTSYDGKVPDYLEPAEAALLEVLREHERRSRAGGM